MTQSQKSKEKEAIAFAARFYSLAWDLNGAENQMLAIQSSVDKHGYWYAVEAAKAVLRDVFGPARAEFVDGRIWDWDPSTEHEGKQAIGHLLSEYDHEIEEQERRERGYDEPDGNPCLPCLIGINPKKKRPAKNPKKKVAGARNLVSRALK